MSGTLSLFLLWLSVVLVPYLSYALFSAVDHFFDLDP